MSEYRRLIEQPAVTDCPECGGKQTCWHIAKNSFNCFACGWLGELIKRDAYYKGVY